MRIRTGIQHLLLIGDLASSALLAAEPQIEAGLDIAPVWAGHSVGFCLVTSGEKDVRYVLRWETLGPNRDRPREGALPEPSMLRLHKLKM